ncbi:hypothetical protein [Sphingomonas gei]|nr:hypothetical protein [Sphingomonas gei]
MLRALKHEIPSKMTEAEQRAILALGDLGKENWSIGALVAHA